MDIEIGRLYINRTCKYLLPCLKIYGPTFQTKINSIFNLAFGIHDTLLDGTPFETQRAIYMLCDKMFQPTKFDNFLNYVKNQEYYIIDYAFDDLENGRKHMVVIRFPEKYSDVYDKFLESKYSKMYCKDEIEEFFPDNSEAKGVIKQSNEMGNIFIEKVFRTFGTRLTLKDLKVGGMEYDFPLEKEEEFFNYEHSNLTKVV